MRKNILETPSHLIIFNRVNAAIILCLTAMLTYAMFFI